MSSFASDVYAMGAMCFEMITGGPPFAGGSSGEIMRRHLEELAVPMSCRRPGVPPALDHFVATALAKVPEQRYRSAAVMADALAAVEDEIRETIKSSVDASPVLYSPEATTSPINMEHAPTERVAVDKRRHEVSEAMRTGNADLLVIAYLELARSLVDIHQLALAIRELEQGVALLAHPGLGTSDTPIWRLQLTLAALYDGSGDRARACQIMREAHLLASRQGSAIGKQRACELFSRLMHRRATRRPRDCAENA